LIECNCAQSCNRCKHEYGPRLNGPIRHRAPARRTSAREQIDEQAATGSFDAPSRHPKSTAPVALIKRFFADDRESGTHAARKKSAGTMVVERA